MNISTIEQATSYIQRVDIEYLTESIKEHNAEEKRDNLNRVNKPSFFE